ncbi:hypothetical protein KC356_g184 [Hortaea werneckii]|nr:hypothetical protein KC356_g184 [Hortaea werneckii]
MCTFTVLTCRTTCTFLPAASQYVSHEKGGWAVCALWPSPFTSGAGRMSTLGNRCLPGLIGMSVISKFEVSVSAWISMANSGLCASLCLLPPNTEFDAVHEVDSRNFYWNSNLPMNFIGNRAGEVKFEAASMLMPLSKSIAELGLHRIWQPSNGGDSTSEVICLASPARQYTAPRWWHSHPSRDSQTRAVRYVLCRLRHQPDASGVLQMSDVASAQDLRSRSSRY